MLNFRARIDWTEDRKEGVFLIIADRTTSGKWEFSERESYEASWSRVPTTPQLLKELRRAIEELRAEMDEKAK
jgi:hypothetical protein